MCRICDKLTHNLWQWLTQKLWIRVSGLRIEAFRACGSTWFEGFSIGLTLGISPSFPIFFSWKMVKLRVKLDFEQRALILWFKYAIYLWLLDRKRYAQVMIVASHGSGALNSYQIPVSCTAVIILKGLLKCQFVNWYVFIVWSDSRSLTGDQSRGHSLSKDLL